MTTTSYGAWPSPLSAAQVAAGSVVLSWPRLVGAEVWWSQMRPTEGGRVVVVRRGADGVVQDVLPAPWNARSRVHEYGGCAWTVADGDLVFADFGDQRLWRLAVGGAQHHLGRDWSRRANRHFCAARAGASLSG